MSGSLSFCATWRAGYAGLLFAFHFDSEPLHLLQWKASDAIESAPRFLLLKQMSCPTS